MVEVKLEGKFETLDEVTRFYRLLSHALPQTHYDTVTTFLDEKGYIVARGDVSAMKEEYDHWLTSLIRRD